MNAPNSTRSKAVGKHWQLTVISTTVLLSGLITIFSILLAEFRHRTTEITTTDAFLSLFSGLSFVYLASLLKRGKRSAWLVTVPLYGYIFVRNIWRLVVDHPVNRIHFLGLFLNILLPLIALIALVAYQHLFTVRSELRNFNSALRRSVLILLVAFIFGTVGFQLLDKRDFHQEIPILSGMHYTIDQFGLTTQRQLVPHTKRAKLFLDSLTFISFSALLYVAISFFSPIRFRLGQEHDYEQMQALLAKGPANSEDFLKIWPKDKAYFFNASRTSGLAYHAVGGVALCVSDPVGKELEFPALLENFMDYCYINDWGAALIHTEERNQALYERLGFDTQKIGEEAVIEISHFINDVVNNKYFRHINNKFIKTKYSTDLLKPPHSPAVIKRLKEISDDWLKVQGRRERTFMLGYFSEAYMQMCNVMVVRDDAGTMQAFLNQIPSFNPNEANVDFIRHTRTSPGNINDFLLINFINYLGPEGFKTFNLGLCPLVGLDDNETSEGSALDTFLKLVYAGGNRLYSFKGLERFKAKYEPNWQSRFIVYQGGIRGFTRTSNALLRAMRVRRIKT